MKTLKYFLLIFLFLTPLILSGQSLDVTNNFSNNNSTVIAPLNYSQQTPIKITDPITDEYGETGNNAFLGGGVGYYLAVPDAGGLYNLTSSGTIEAWIMPTATTSSAPAILAKGDVTNVNFFLYWQASSSLLGFRIGNTPLTNTGGTTVPLNQWSHVAVTWTGTAGNYTVTFYVNGAISGAPATSAGTFNAATLGDSLTIGSSRSGFTGVAFYGYIDEAKIWNVARTQTQIAQSRFVGIGDYTGANTGNAITSGANYTGLLSSWTFNNNYRDDIGGKLGYARNSAGLYWYPYTAGFPIPYNFAIYRPAALATNYVTVPSNAAFDLNTGGTIEYWFNTSTASTTQWTVNKGTSASNMWGTGIASTGYMVIRFGSNPVVNTGGISIPANKWVHLAFTWTGTSGNYTTKYYVNGQQSGANTPNTGTLTSNTDPICIGLLQPFSGFGLLGYVDEVRIWNTERTQQQIKDNMFASCRSILPNVNLVGAWNFDGNLRNFAVTAGTDGSFSTGTNNCRISAYSNEATITVPAPNVVYEAHPTVLNSTGYPTGYTQKNTNTPIPDNSTLTDVMAIATTGTLNDIQVFVSIQHMNASDLTVKLKAPNNTEVILSTAQGGTSKNGYLTIFDDTTGNLVTSTTYLSPWTQYVKPQNTMGTFGSTTLNGNWTLTVTDGVAGNTGTLLGWGLRFNNSVVVGTQNISELPYKFNLSQNYPNPFNPETNIKFSVPKQSKVILKIYDVLGQEVITLVNEYLAPGTYEKIFNASSFASGVYFYKLEAGEFNAVKKMVLIK
jgi:subtilisin-like proprotein convertase family protein